jgi:hypothetical protein
MYIQIKCGRKTRRVVIGENFRFLVGEKTGAFWLAYPKNSKRSEEIIFWETATADSGKIAAVTPDLFGGGKINARVMARICANLLGLDAVRTRTRIKKKKDVLEFVFKKIKKSA